MAAIEKAGDSKVYRTPKRQSPRRLATFLLHGVMIAGALLVIAESATAAADRDASRAGNFSQEPRLVSGQSILVAPSVVKRGIRGTVAVEINVGRDGTVEDFSIPAGSNPFLDSLLRAAVPRFVYSPAIENGKAVSSTLLLQIEFNPDSILSHGGAAAPEIEGVVLDRESETPLTDAVINIQFTDSTSDPDIVTGFADYIERIGKIPGQSCYKGILSTSADSTGHFAFRLLPSCPAIVSIQSRGHEIAHTTERPRTGQCIRVSYFLDTIVRDPQRSDSAYTITVYGRSAGKNAINVERQQVASGLTHFVSKLIISQATIRQVPEAASALLVRSGSPFDNLYVIAGVPMPAPFHFGGNPYADIDGLMVSSLREMNITVDGIAARRIDASGAQIEANPGIYRPANPVLIRRPELVIDYSTTGQDFQLSFPVSANTDDFFQAAITRSEDYQLKWLYCAYATSPEAELNNGIPKTYTNITLTGMNTAGKTRINSFAWFALDAYRHETIPWGMASVRLHPEGREEWSLDCGGARQFFAQGKRVGRNAFLKRVFISNGVVEGHADRAIGDDAALRLDCRIDYQEWHGSVRQRDTSGIDTVCDASGKETGCHVHGELKKDFGLFEAKTDVVCAGILYENAKDVLLDAGVSFSKTMGNFHAALHFGQVTSRPDVRGLPDTAFRRKPIPAYLASCPVGFQTGSKLKIGVKPYLRFMKECPAMNPLLFTWDTAEVTAMRALGADIDGELQVTRSVAVLAAVNIASARRFDGKQKSTYEWHVPWTVRAGAHYSFFGQRGHLYVHYIAMPGLPYYDFRAKGYQTLPDYKRVDVSLQYRTRMEQHRFFTRYDAYIDVNNLFDRVNIRDFYWDYEMKKKLMILSPVMLAIGLRACFRL